MIKPYKHMELDTSVLNVTASIINNLINCKEMKYNTLYANVCSELAGDAKYNFDMALSFLFLLGKLEYNQQNDIMELIR